MPHRPLVIMGSITLNVMANVHIRTFNPLIPKLKKHNLSDAMRIGSIIIFHLSKLWKAKFFILCDVIFLVRLQGKFENDHSWEWKCKADYYICLEVGWVAEKRQPKRSGDIARGVDKMLFLNEMQSAHPTWRDRSSQWKNISQVSFPEIIVA